MCVTGLYLVGVEVSKALLHQTSRKCLKDTFYVLIRSSLLVGFVSTIKVNSHLLIVNDRTFILRASLIRKMSRSHFTAELSLVSRTCSSTVAVKYRCTSNSNLSSNSLTYIYKHANRHSQSFSLFLSHTPSLLTHTHTRKGETHVGGLTPHCLQCIEEYCY